MALLLGSLAWATLSAPATGSASAFASASSSWHCKPFFSASRASRSAFSFFQRQWYQITSPSNLRHSAAALTPQANTSAIATSSSYHTSENLAAGSALIKLVDGRRVLRGEPPGRFVPGNRGCGPQQTDFQSTEGQTVRLRFLPYESGRTPRLIGSALDSLTLANRQADGRFLSARY
ncbi:LOW QUALITY PROTEIN: hypothetical protein Cgig2_006336 [Carnegiea gigantea]|uniref:Uncharacterized protein n=1 Tax=Carnegiea gigantea TaxID=171969 RepID=A0A9Q1GL39_9CARY|nr:LOW QUALITY PROTEIN: hypothetical protein Cgig2_006336 [Carnegiea gigantea]